MKTKEMLHVLREAAAYYRRWDDTLAAAQAALPRLPPEKVDSTIDTINRMQRRRMQMVDELGLTPGELAQKCDALMREIDAFHAAPPDHRHAGMLIALATSIDPWGEAPWGEE